MFVEVRAVEAEQGVLVHREVRWHPVEQHADTALVEPVDQGHQLDGCAVTSSRGEVPGHLVAPRAVVRVLHHREQLDVGETVAEHVVGQRVGELVEARPAPPRRGQPAPRAEVHLVDRDRRVSGDRRGPPVDPRPVLPGVAQVGDARRRRRRFERCCGDGVGPFRASAIGRGDPEPVAVTDLGTGGVAGPHSRVGRRREGNRLLPAGEVADDIDGLGVRRPHGEPAAGLVGMGAEEVEDPAVRPLVEQVEVELAGWPGDRGHEWLRAVSVRRCRRTAGSTNVSDVGWRSRRRQIVGRTLPGMLCGVVSPSRSSRSALTR